MQLNKNTWDEKDIKKFQIYLKTFENKEKIQWCKNILQTNLPILCMKTIDIKCIVNNISKGNYIEFLNYMLWDYYENTAINGFLICKIKEFNLMKKYLDIYSFKADNWATCDLLKFNIKGNEKKFYTIATEYIKSDKPFVKRIGLGILFNFINNAKYIEKIYYLLDQFEQEEHYYVNMMNAWLLCELFIKQREKTIQYLNNNKLNKFTINKCIQKCRDSHRVSLQDKNMLLKYKINSN